MSNDWFQPGTHGDPGQAARSYADTVGQDFARAQFDEMQRRGAGERQMAEFAWQKGAEAEALQHEAWRQATTQGTSAPAPATAYPSSASYVPPASAPVKRPSTSHTHGASPTQQARQTAPTQPHYYPGKALGLTLVAILLLVICLSSYHMGAQNYLSGLTGTLAFFVGCGATIYYFLWFN